MFSSKPDFPTLGLDLAEVDGGGSCPTQFFGRTTDDRPVYIRYRGGWLSVDQGEPGADAHAPMERLHKASIGPDFDGDILLEQVCEIAGITINGRKPVLTPEAFRKASVRDFSGRTTYWERPNAITRQGGQIFVDALKEAFPELRVVKVEWNGRGRGRWVPGALSDWPEGNLCFGPAGVDVLERLNADDHARLGDGFQFVASSMCHELTNDDVFPRRSFDHVRRSVGQEISIAKTYRSSLAFSFKTGDVQGEAFARKIIAVAEAYLPRWKEVVDLQTGDLVDRGEFASGYTLDVADWCHAGPGRFLYCWLDDDSEPPRPLGIRPCSPIEEMD